MALTPEQRMRVIAEIQKRKDVTPEQHQKLGKLWLDSLQQQDQPVQPASVVSDALKTGGQGTEALGTLAATGGDVEQASQVAQGQPATTTAGKVGQIAGNMVSPASIGMAAAAAPALKVAGEALAPVGSAIKEAVTGAKQARLLALQRELGNLPLQAAEKETALAGIKQEAGNALNVAQKAKGVGMEVQGIPQVPKDLNDFADSMRVLAQKSPEDLSKAMDVGGLQKLKDMITIARQSGKLTPVQNAFVNRAATQIDNAIGQQVPDLAEKLANVRTATDAQEALSGDTALRKVQLRNAINQIRSDIKLSGAEKVKAITSMILKGTAVGAAGAIGYKKLTH